MTDLDNDGVTDIVFVDFNRTYLLHGLGKGQFEYANRQWGLPATRLSRGMCSLGDIDGDGRLDLAMDGRVYHNDLPARHWLDVQLVGKKGNRMAAGACIRIYQAGAGGDAQKLLWYEQVCKWGRLGFKSEAGMPLTQRHFGLGERATVDVTVTFFPSGKVVQKKDVKADAVVQVTEE